MKTIQSILLVSLLTATSSAVSIFMPRSVLAIPGQSVSQTEQMVQRSSLFQGLGLSADPYWPGSYTVSRPYDGGDAVLYVDVENGTVVSETLQFRYPNSTISFERDSTFALGQLESLWGASVAGDFANSRYTDVIQENGFNADNHFYLGEQYGYKLITLPDSTTGKSIYSFSIMTLPQWEESRQMVRFCLNNPSHNDCSGI